MIHLTDGEVRNIPIEELDFMKRYACKYCGDYTAEFADISFGGIGAEEGWTTLISRTPLGRAVCADARGTAIQEYSIENNPNFASDALSLVRSAAAKKKKNARQNRRELGDKPVNIKD